VAGIAVAGRRATLGVALVAAVAGLLVALLAVAAAVTALLAVAGSATLLVLALLVVTLLVVTLLVVVAVLVVAVALAGLRRAIVGACAVSARAAVLVGVAVRACGGTTRGRRSVPAITWIGLRGLTARVVARVLRHGASSWVRVCDSLWRRFRVRGRGAPATDVGIDAAAHPELSGVQRR